MSVWTTAGIIADGTFDDPENARIIYLAVGGLLLMAVCLGVGTWFWWRNAKVEHPALGPLEVMGTRRWWRSDFNDRRRRLDAARPLHDTDGDGVPDTPATADPVDLDLVMTRDDPQNFDDLIEPAAAGAVAAAVMTDEPVSADEPAIEPVGETVEPVADEPVAEAATVAPEPAAEPEPEQLALVDIAEAVPPRPAIITVDTAPKRAEPEVEPEPEAKDSDPTPLPIDPLLRLQID